MVFSSQIFILLFLPAFLLAYLAAEKSGRIKLKNAVVLIFSLGFYAWGGLKYLAIVILLVLANYVIAVLMDRFPARKKLLLALCVCIDLANLLYHKYFGFFADNVRILAEQLGWGSADGLAVNVVLPIGISFYTFQIMSYVIDVYRGEVKAQKCFFRLLMYVIMFPQLIAGPIVRYKDVDERIAERTSSWDGAAAGMKRFIVGFTKKVFLANAAGKIADIVFCGYEGMNSPLLFIGAACYTLQIYYDFSAYSDMAIGLGRIIGFDFIENFDNPYVSTSIREFWRRWHISLSTWFRDYVYIPLGGSRRGEGRTYLNLLIVFLLTGFWHGADWQFIVWGLYHGFFLVIERIGFDKVLERLPKILRHTYCLLVVLIGWIFFRADSLPVALAYIKNMLSFNFTACGSWELANAINPLLILSLASCVIGIIPAVRTRILSAVNSEKTVVNALYAAVYSLTILYMTGLDYNPFIYFKF